MNKDLFMLALEKSTLDIVKQVAAKTGMSYSDVISTGINLVFKTYCEQVQEKPKEPSQNRISLKRQKL